MMQTALNNAVVSLEPEPAAQSDPGSDWHVLWTRSNCEQLVHAQLLAKGYELFLPTIGTWARRRGLRCFRTTPLFPGYLFLRHAIDKYSYLDVHKTRGMVKILGSRWDRLAVVPDRQIEALRKVMQSDLPKSPCAYLREGQLVRITQGPLANVEGILHKSNARRGLLVLSIELLQRSVAVEVDCRLVVPA